MLGRVSTHSHPKVAADDEDKKEKRITDVSTHSHPKVAALNQVILLGNVGVSTHSHPKVAAVINSLRTIRDELFQHTATRRWLLPT